MSEHYDPDLNERKYRPAPAGPGEEVSITGEARLARDDLEIAKDVERSLFYDDFVKSIGIQIDCHQGVVTLSGTVDDDAERRRAVNDASRVAGAKQVIDHLELAKQAGS